MPINFAKLYEELNRKKNEFIKYDKDFFQELKNLKDLMKDGFELDYDEIMDRINNRESPEPVGAIPHEEYKEEGLLVNFPLDFSDPKMVYKRMDWAVEILKNRILGASDGSQVYPSTEFSVPVALVQVVNFTNYHKPDGQYEKRFTLEVLTPEQIAIEDDEGRIQYKQESVDAYRFKKEIETLIEEMNNITETPEKLPLFFIDGSLILSFLTKFSDRNRRIQLEALRDLIKVSKNKEIPIVGYVDNSHAKDVMGLITFLGSGTTGSYKKVSDAYLIENYITEGVKHPLKPGDRTCAFICDRNDEIYEKYPYIVESKIGFFYIKLNAGEMARVEFPEWILHGETDIVKKRLDTITEIILAQTIVGIGYPYIIDQCHHACIIHSEEREKFYRTFQKFCETNGISFEIRNKARSKMRRAF